VNRTALRTALIWHDEVMDDVVLEKPRTITIGADGTATFTTPELGLPANFAIVKPGNRGYLLTLGENMGGKLCIDGEEKDVSEFVRRGGEGGFHGTPIDGKDWGLIELDSSGHHKLFFQFVPLEEAPDTALSKYVEGLLVPFAALAILFAMFVGGLLAYTVANQWLADAVAAIIAVIVGGASGALMAFYTGAIRFTVPMIIMGAISFGSTTVMGAIAWWIAIAKYAAFQSIKAGASLDHALAVGSHTPAVSDVIFLGALSASLVLIVSGIIASMLTDDSDSMVALAFSVVLHAAILFMTYQLYQPENPFVWPGPKSLTGNYLVTRLDPEPPPEPEKPKPTAVAQKSDGASLPKSETKKNTGTKGEDGKSGGKGETERARDPNADETQPKEPPKVAFFEDKNRKMLDNIIDRNLSTSLSKFTGIKGDLRTGSIGFGKGSGSGVGDDLMGTGTHKGSKGNGTGAGGTAEGDFVSGKGHIDTGGERAGGTCKGAGCDGSGMRQIAVKMEDATGDFNGLSKEEIDRVVKARAGVFRACYQKELNRSPGIGGKLIINFVIDGEGTVKSARTNGGSLKNDGVESCVKSNIMRLKFPAKGGAIVNYPFVFTQGG
jgi:hypothetical protein